MREKKRVVVIGGGTGTMAVLSGLKDAADLDISVIVSVTDDGGSNKVVRDEFGLLPLSDLRKSIIALSQSDNQLLRQLFTYRFDKGIGISGHTLGNLMMIALSDITGSEVGAIDSARRLFQVQGSVIPVTLEKTELVATYDSGDVVTGEHIIDEPRHKEARRITHLGLSSDQVQAYPKAIEAIASADMIVAGPGDLYTSTLANIIVPGIAEAIAAAKAQYVFINNLMTKRGQTDHMSASEIVAEIARYSKRTPDIVLQHTGNFPDEVLSMYRDRGEAAIIDDMQDVSYRVCRESFVYDETIVKDSGDTLMRSLIRHDAQKVKKVLLDLLAQI